MTRVALVLALLVLGGYAYAQQDWDTAAPVATGVEVELVLTIPASGLPADITASVAAFTKDASGATVASRHVETTADVKALLTLTQQAALADIMTALHTKAVEKLLPE